MNVKTQVNLYLSKFFFKCQMLYTKVSEEMKTHILSSIKFCRKSWCLSDSMEKYGGAKQATLDNIMRLRKYAISMPDS